MRESAAEQQAGDRSHTIAGLLSQPVSRGLWIVLAVAVPLTLVIVRPVETDRARVQHFNLMEVEKLIPRVERRLAADPKWKEVQAGCCTSQNGSLGLMGSVETAEDLFSLMRAIAAENLPVPIFWNVTVTKDVEAK